jgi:hypothetical protein
MTMELLYSGFPALHNSPSWKNYGYYYEAADLAGGAAELTAIFKHHRDRLETYRAHAEAIQWRHSPYNPDNQAAWEKILKG